MMVINREFTKPISSFNFYYYYYTTDVYALTS